MCHTSKCLAAPVRISHLVDDNPLEAQVRDDLEELVKVDRLYDVARRCGIDLQWQGDRSAEPDCSGVGASE